MAYSELSFQTVLTDCVIIVIYVLRREFICTDKDTACVTASGKSYMCAHD